MPTVTVFSFNHMDIKVTIILTPTHLLLMQQEPHIHTNSMNVDDLWGVVQLCGSNLSLADTSVAGGVYLPFTYNAMRGLLLPSGFR
jgi:hypothetical protein